MTAAAEPTMPAGRALRPRLGRDDILMRGYMVVIAAYVGADGRVDLADLGARLAAWDRDL